MVLIPEEMIWDKADNGEDMLNSRIIVQNKVYILFGGVGCSRLKTFVPNGDSRTILDRY